ncbi:MAG: hypothetical protein V4506_04375 [Bacteroidota bacterium]
MKLQGHFFATRINLITWLPIILAMIVAAYMRFRTNSNLNYLLIGGDGPYYPLQIRSILEQQKLAFPDMPLLFIFEGLIAGMLDFFHVASYNNCVLLAAKLTDAIIPPLAAIPVFLIVKELNTPGITSRFLNYLLVYFALFNFTTSLVFSNGLQKNAVAVVWLFFYFYFVIRLIKYEQKKDLYYLGLVLLLCVLTHFGSFALLIFFTALIGIFWLMYHKQAIRSFTWKKAAIILSALILFLLMIAYFDSGRFQRLISIPLKVFEFPVLLLMLSGYGIENFLSPLHLIVGNPLALIALISLIIYRKKISKENKLIAWALVVATFFLVSPFIGLEWANRLYIMSYIPIVVLYLILFNSIKSKWLRIVPAGLFTLLIAMSIMGIRANTPCITQESYTEFVQIQQYVKFNENDAIIGRQDLRLLGSWEFRTKSIVDYLFKKEDFNRYHAVYVIRQIKGSNFPSGRFRGDARIPDNSIKVYSGECFELYQLKSGEGWKGGKGKPSKAHGKIISITPTQLVLQNDNGFMRTVELTDHTIIEMALKKGMSVEVWGNWKPFSLNVVAESIEELNNQN